ncbi:MAG: hypothetical protein FWH04_07620 [Oscillospiraceae bacterium]|nr:hypothetical protein [Oscillospiraceae bacterium]
MTRKTKRIGTLSLALVMVLSLLPMQMGVLSADDDIKSISIKSHPDKMEYIQSKPLELAGLTVDITYEDGSAEENIPYSSFAEFGLAVDFADGIPMSVMAHDGKPITVTVIGSDPVISASTEERIKVNPRSIEDIEIISQPDKMSYTAGEGLELEGIVVDITYSDGEVETVDYTNFPSSVLRTSPENRDILRYSQNDTPVVINALGSYVKAATDPLQVRGITEIEIAAQPAKLSYTAGERLSLVGMEVNLTYSDGTTVDNLTYSANNFLKYGLESLPANGEQLTEDDDAAAIEVFFREDKAETAVSAGSLTVSGFDGGEQTIWSGNFSYNSGTGYGGYTESFGSNVTQNRRFMGFELTSPSVNLRALTMFWSAAFDSPAERTPQEDGTFNEDSPRLLRLYDFTILDSTGTPLESLDLEGESQTVYIDLHQYNGRSGVDANRDINLLDKRIDGFHRNGNLGPGSQGTVTRIFLTDGFAETQGIITGSALIPESNAIITPPEPGQPLVTTVNALNTNSMYVIREIRWYDAGSSIPLSAGELAGPLGTLYDVQIDFVANNGYVFADKDKATTMRVNGQIPLEMARPVNVMEVTLSHTIASKYPAKPLLIRVKSQPQLEYVEDETLDLTDLVLEILYDDDSIAEVRYADFTDNDITVSLLGDADPQDTVMKTHLHHGEHINIMYTYANATPPFDEIELFTFTEPLAIFSCCIDYNDKSEIIIPSTDAVAGTPALPTINLTLETIDLAGFVPAEFDIGKGYKKIKPDKVADTFGAVKFPKMMNKELTLKLKNAAGEEVVFPKINKRPKPQKLAINYLLGREAVSCLADEASGCFNGQWLLTTKVKKGETPEYLAIKPTLQIGLAALIPNAKDPSKPPKPGKTVDENGWGKFYRGDSGICVKPLPVAEKPKVLKTTYFVRTAAKPDEEDGSYWPASKAKKFKASSQLKKPKYKIDLKKNIIKYKKDTYVSVNDGEAVYHADKGQLAYAAGSTYTLWQAATAKKPSSAKQILPLPTP